MAANGNKLGMIIRPSSWWWWRPEIATHDKSIWWKIVSAEEVEKLKKQRRPTFSNHRETHVPRLFSHAHWRNHRKILSCFGQIEELTSFRRPWITGRRIPTPCHPIHLLSANKQSIVLSVSHISADPPPRNGKK